MVVLCFSVVVWVLDRLVCRQLLASMSRKRSEEIQKFLASVPLLQKLSLEETSMLADAAKELKFKVRLLDMAPFSCDYFDL